MWTTASGTPFIVIGENIHATRVVLRSGKSVTMGPDGRESVRYVDARGAEHLLPIPEEVTAGQEFANGRVKQVRAAVVNGMSGGPDAEAGIDFIRSLAQRQEAARADYLDLNVDEVTPDPARQVAAIRWLVGVVEAASTLPIALDSSSAAVIDAGLAASSRETSAILLNSASIERLDVLDLAARGGGPVVLSAAGAGSMPANAGERVANAERMINAALDRGIGLGRLHVDALVLPVAVDPEVGSYYLDAVRRLRTTYGPDIHLTGGFSNVSFGLPARRLVNDVFIGLAADAGADSGIIDPLAADSDRVFGIDRGSHAYRLAADLLTGVDPYGMEFLTAFRSGELAAAPA
jgi:5-methyltetrahydrofolate--homocysteine methyltransferase